MQKQKFLEKLLSVAGFSCALYLFLPLVVYLLNIDSVYTPKMAILLSGFACAFTLSCILIVFSLIPGIGCWICTFSQLGLIAIVVLTIFPNQTGELSGFAATTSGLRGLLSSAKVIAVLAGGVWIAWRKPGLLPKLSHYALLVVIVIIGYVTLVPLSIADKSAEQREAVPSDSFTQLGKAKNVVVVIFDCFTGYRMAEVMHEHPELRADLPGFVYYPAALASAKNTPAGLGAILTGDLKKSLVSGSLGERVAGSFNSSFLADAKRIGYTTGIITNFGGKNVDIPVAVSNYFFEQRPLSILNRLPSYLGFFSLSLSRIAPDFVTSMVKKGVERITERIKQNARTDWDLLNSLQNHLERKDVFSKMALAYFINNLHVTDGMGSVLVLHSLLTHPPNNLTDSGSFSPEVGRGYEGASVYAARELARLCEKLRSLGVYDSTLIIAVADHGAIAVKDMTMGGRFLSPKLLPVDYNSLIMIKAPGASGPCRDSSMSVWLGDVATTVRNFLNIPVDAHPLIASRSLLIPEDPHRTLKVPVFTRPGKASYHSSLNEWVRHDFEGTFVDYGTIFASKVETQLQQRAKIVLFHGIDQAEKSGKKTCFIEVNGRLLVKLDNKGIAIVTGNENGYQTQSFSDLAAAEAFLKKIPADHDRLAVGLNVPADLPERLFPRDLSMAASKTPVGFLAVAGPSYGQKPKVVAGVDDLNLEILWKPSTKD